LQVFDGSGLVSKHSLYIVISLGSSKFVTNECKVDNQKVLKKNQFFGFYFPLEIIFLKFFLKKNSIQKKIFKTKIKKS
jgi:hypothetical protein